MTTPGPEVSARLAWPDDATAIARVQLAAWSADRADVLPEGWADDLAGPALAERWASLVSRPPDARLRTLVALDGATVCGFALVHPAQDPDADRGDGELAELQVEPARRRVGHGSRLLHAVIDTLKADGFTRAVWWVGADDDALRTFATSAGWQADGAHRSLADDSGATVRQVRLHVALEG